MTLPQIDALPTHLSQRGGDPGLVCDEYVDVITHAIRNNPRSLQRAIGPSEVGHTCSRRIGYKLLDYDDINTGEHAPWLPTVGTGVHGWLEETFTLANSGRQNLRWLVELRVEVGEVGGQVITGSCDLYDRVTATVFDHKIVGATTLKRVKANKHPGDQYRTQIHLYGRGLARRGLPVDHVAIAFLPRNAELHDRYIWHEPYAEQVALAGLERAEGIALATTALGADALATLPTADAFCHRCPYFRHGSIDPATGCPGHPQGDQTRRQDQILAII
jgi:hypothetical protein